MVAPEKLEAKYQQQQKTRQKFGNYVMSIPKNLDSAIDNDAASLFLRTNFQFPDRWGVLETNITLFDGNIGQKKKVVSKSWFESMFDSRIFVTTEPMIMFLRDRYLRRELCNVGSF